VRYLYTEHHYRIRRNYPIFDDGLGYCRITTRYNLLIRVCVVLAKFSLDQIPAHLCPNSFSPAQQCSLPKAAAPSPPPHSPIPSPASPLFRHHASLCPLGLTPVFVSSPASPLFRPHTSLHPNGLTPVSVPSATASIYLGASYEHPYDLNQFFMSSFKRKFTDHEH
jgi:hypothetical protein